MFLYLSGCWQVEHCERRAWSLFQLPHWTTVRTWTAVKPVSSHLIYLSGEKHSFTLFQPLPLWLVVLWPPLSAEESATAARRLLVGKFSRTLKSIFVPDKSWDAGRKEAARGQSRKIETFIRS